MTDDELICAANETIARLEEYRKQILERYAGRIVKAYGGKRFRVEDAEFKHGNIWLRGSILKMNGDAHARLEYGVPVDDAKFLS